MKYIIIIISLLVLIRTNVLSQAENTHYQDSISITYIANAGFLIEMRDFKIVIDGFFKEGFDKYDYPDTNMIYLMKNNLSPFNDIDFIFVTHSHLDHFDAALLTKHLTNNKKAKLFCPNQVNDLLKIDTIKYSIIKERIITMLPDTNSYEKIRCNDITVTACRLWHGKKQNKDIENIGFIIEHEGKIIFHSGDATLKDFDGLDGYIADRKIDIAILHNSFGSIEFLNKTDSLVNADNYIFMHLTKDYANMFYTFYTKNPDLINNPHIFRKTMEKKTYLSIDNNNK